MSLSAAHDIMAEENKTAPHYQVQLLLCKGHLIFYILKQAQFDNSFSCPASKTISKTDQYRAPNLRPQTAHASLAAKNVSAHLLQQYL